MYEFFDKVNEFTTIKCGKLPWCINNGNSSQINRNWENYDNDEVDNS